MTDGKKEVTVAVSFDEVECIVSLARKSDIPAVKEAFDTMLAITKLHYADEIATESVEFHSMLDALLRRFADMEIKYGSNN